MIKPLAIKKVSQRYEFTVRCPFCKEILVYKNCKIQNRWIFGFHLCCKNCRMSFLLASSLERIIYKNYALIKPLFTYYSKLKEKFVTKIRK